MNFNRKNSRSPFGNLDNYNTFNSRKSISSIDQSNYKTPKSYQKKEN